MDDNGLGTHECLDDDSETDENGEIFDLETRDFDDVDGIQSEL